MVVSIYGADAPARNCDGGARPADPTHIRRLTAGTRALLPRADLVRHPGLASDAQVRILTVVDEGDGEATLGGIAGALPDHPWPISAVLALVDVGLLALDLQAPFDADLRVRRADRRA
ncbi:hypothetical protein [Microvirga massiliensis]|uniref:hypothetical protein n=1 Tax=Microvirga massiliensis TaxID=1033741 RepID=UPI00062BE48B|nr:hypothetical protein [Microvirga massiliensis]